MGAFGELIDQVKRDVPIGLLLPGGVTPHKKIRCPIPGHDDENPSFEVNAERNTWVCWSHPFDPCRGSVADLAIALTGRTFPEAIRYCADLAGIRHRPPTEKEKAEVQERLQREAVLEAVTAWAQDRLWSDHVQARRMREYLTGRGFGEDLLRSQRLGWMDLDTLSKSLGRDPKLQGISRDDAARAGLFLENLAPCFRDARISIPVLHHEHVVGMTFRTLDPTNKRKYMHLAGQPAGLYNLDALKGGREIILTEGIPDCWTLMQWGIAAVANLGVEAVAHAKRFAGCTRVVLAWDNDTTGRGRAVRSARAIQDVLGDTGEVAILHVPEQKDVSDWAQAGGTPEDFRVLAAQAPDLIGYQLDRVPNASKGQRLDVKAQMALDALLDDIGRLPVTRQGAYLTALGKRIITSPGDLRRLIRERQAERERREAAARSAAGEGATRTDEDSEDDYDYHTQRPCIAATDFVFPSDGPPRGNIGFHLSKRVDGLWVPTKQLVEVEWTPDGPTARRVLYAQRQVGDKELARFPMEGMPRWSLEEGTPFSIKQFITNPAACRPNTAELFARIRTLLQQFLWYPDPGSLFVVAIYVLLSYVFALFGSLGLLHFNGNAASGKSLSMDFMERLCFNALKTGSITGAALFRLTHATRPTLLIDEAERLANPGRDTPEEAVRLILNESYRVNGMVIRTNPETLQPERFSTFGPKCLASIKELDAVLGSRCIVIPCLAPDHKVELEDAIQSGPRLDRLCQDLRNHLHCWNLSVFPLLYRIYTEDLVGQFKGLKGRQREIWLPPITLARLVDAESSAGQIMDVEDQILATQERMASLQEKRARLENEHVLVLSALRDILLGDDRRQFELLMHPHKFNVTKLSEAIRDMLVTSGAWFPSRPFGTRQLTRILRSNNVASEADHTPRVSDGGRTVHAVLLHDQRVEDALRRLVGGEEMELGFTGIASGIVTDGTAPVAQENAHDAGGDDDLPF
ncbi:MAG: toprim domain-containing protein [Candidatus Delongbacteria bacterium]